MNGGFSQQARISSNLGALVADLRAAMVAERLANEQWAGPEDRSDIDAASARISAQARLSAALMALGVSPVDARGMVWSIDEQALAVEDAA
jgi:hypothetical protein